MKKLIVALSMAIAVGAMAGCSSERHTKTTTTETVQSAPDPMDPVTTQKRVTVHSETRTKD